MPAMTEDDVGRIGGFVGMVAKRTRVSLLCTHLWKGPERIRLGFEDSRLDRIRRSCLVDVASLLAAVSERESPGVLHV